MYIPALGIYVVYTMYNISTGSRIQMTQDRLGQTRTDSDSFAWAYRVRAWPSGNWAPWSGSRGIVLSKLPAGQFRIASPSPRHPFLPRRSCRPPRGPAGGAWTRWLLGG